MRISLVGRPSTATTIGGQSPRSVTRPAPAIQRFRPTWEPLAPTPAHPEYPAGHTCYAGATEHVLQAFFGDKVTFSLTHPVMKITRNYQSLSQMGKEVEDARVWGGMHYRTAGVHGAELGHKIADYGLKNYLRPVNPAGGN